MYRITYALPQYFAPAAFSDIFSPLINGHHVRSRFTTCVHCYRHAIGIRGWSERVNCLVAYGGVWLWRWHLMIIMSAAMNSTISTSESSVSPATQSTHSRGGLATSVTNSNFCLQLASSQALLQTQAKRPNELDWVFLTLDVMVGLRR
jgi:hypothetical protein